MRNSRSHLGFSCFLTKSWDVGNQAMWFLGNICCTCSNGSICKFQQHLWNFTNTWVFQVPEMGITQPAVPVSLAVVHEKSWERVSRLVRIMSQRFWGFSFEIHPTCLLGSRWAARGVRRRSWCRPVPFQCRITQTLLRAGFPALGTRNSSSLLISRSLPGYCLYRKTLWSHKSLLFIPAAQMRFVLEKHTGGTGHSDLTEQVHLDSYWSSEV